MAEGLRVPGKLSAASFSAQTVCSGLKIKNKSEQFDKLMEFHACIGHSPSYTKKANNYVSRQNN
jgi:hypothetical protein